MKTVIYNLFEECSSDPECFNQAENIVKDLSRFNILVRNSEEYDQSSILSVEQVTEALYIFDIEDLSTIINGNMIRYMYSKGYSRVYEFAIFVGSGVVMKHYVKWWGNASRFVKFLAAYVFIIGAQVFSDGNHRTAAYALFKYGLGVNFGDEPVSQLNDLYQKNYGILNDINKFYIESSSNPCYYPTNVNNIYSFIEKIVGVASLKCTERDFILK